ncbi:MAG: FlgO family outer membrane protein [Aestuariibacter sp.]
MQTPAQMMSEHQVVSHTRNLVTDKHYSTRANQPMLRVPGSAYQPRYTHKLLNDYAEQITMQLMQKAKKLMTHSTLGVGSFVMLNKNLQTTSVLGNQLAESFMNEIQSYGVSVVDFKTMDGVTVADNGDYIFSRFGSLSDPDMDYVLSGTLQQSQRGVQVNARIIQLNDKVVVASAKGFIPHFVVSSLTPEYVLLN